MILVDASIWIDHLRAGDDRLARLLDEGSDTSHTGFMALDTKQAPIYGKRSIGHRRQHSTTQHINGTDE